MNTTEYNAARGTEVTVIGLGAMGSTLARTFASAGCEVTVWNRSPERAAQLASAGCQVARSPAQAVAASPVTVLCVLDEAAVRAVLDGDGVHDALADKVLVNLTTIAADNVERYADVVRAAGGTHLSGGILCYPRSIGSREAVIVYSGARQAYSEHSEMLAALAGAQRFVGDADRDASVMYTASWVYYYGGLGGFLEAAAYASSSGADIRDLDALIPAITNQLAAGLADAVGRIRTGNYSGEQGPVEGHVDGVGTFVSNIRGAGVDADILEGFVTHCRRTTEAGYGSEDIAALFKGIQSR